MNTFTRFALAAFVIFGLSMDADASRVDLPYQHCLDSDGVPLSGCRAYTFEAGTSTVHQLYSDQARTIAHGDFVTADSAGRFPDAYGNPATCIKIIFRESDGSTEVDTLDNVCPPADASSTSDAQTALGLGSIVSESIGTSGNAIGKLNTANTWSALQTYTSGLEVNSTSAAATAAPTIRCSRDSATPAIDDALCEFVLDGKDDGGGDVEYGSIQGIIIDETDTEEDGAVELTAILGAAKTSFLRVGVLDSSDTTLRGADLLVNDQYYYFHTNSTRYPQRRCTLVESQTASSDATLDFTTIPTGAVEFRLEFGDLVPVTDDVMLYVRVKVGGAFQSGVSDYSWSYNPVGASAQQSDTADSEIEIGDNNATQAIGSAAGEFAAGSITVLQPLGTTFTKMIQTNISYAGADGTIRTVGGAGRYVTATSALQGIQLLFESGSVESGTVRAYACFD